MAHDVHRSPLPTVRVIRSSNAENGPGHPALLMPEHPLYQGSFLLDYCNRGCLPAVKQTIIDMSLNASGVRDTARSLHICPNTVLRELKKKEAVLESVNTAVLRTLNPAEVAWDLERAGEAEVDEMWSFVGNKNNPRWLWHAIDHHTGKVLAYVFGRRKDEVFLQLKTLLEPFGLTHYYTDIGGPTPGIWPLTCIAQANATRRKSSASI